MRDINPCVARLDRRRSVGVMTLVDQIHDSVADSHPFLLYPCQQGWHDVFIRFIGNDNFTMISTIPHWNPQLGYNLFDDLALPFHMARRYQILVIKGPCWEKYNTTGNRCDANEFSRNVSISINSVRLLNQWFAKAWWVVWSPIST